MVLYSSECKRAEDVLRKNKASLDEAQRIAHLGSWDWDIVKNELFWSDEIYRIFGLKAKEVDASHEVFYKYVHSDDRAFVKETVNEALKNKKPF